MKYICAGTVQIITFCNDISVGTCRTIEVTKTDKLVNRKCVHATCFLADNHCGITRNLPFIICNFIFQKKGTAGIDLQPLLMAFVWHVYSCQYAFAKSSNQHLMCILQPYENTSLWYVTVCVCVCVCVCVVITRTYENTSL